MPKAKRLGKQKPYTIERLQELRHQADLAGDTDTRDKLAAMIVKQGGTVPTSEIPEDESKVGRLERLRQDALDANDTDTADKLSEMIADEPQLTEGEPEPENTTDESATPHEGRTLTGPDELDPADPRTPPEVMADDVMRMIRDTKAEAVVEERPRFAGDEEPAAPMTQDAILDDYLEEAAVNAYHKGEPEEVLKAIRKGEPAADKWLSPEVQAALHKRRGEPADQSEDKTDDSEPVNNGTASVNAANLIKRKSYLLAEIVARSGGKVDLIDVKAYTKMLTKGV